MNIDECRRIIAKVMPGFEDMNFGPITIGSTLSSADEGAALILSGMKTATSSPLWDFPDGMIPFVGALSVLLDGSGEARAIVRTTAVDIVPFELVDAEFAYAYGEGDRSLAWFVTEMGHWYASYAESTGNHFAKTTPIILEWIEVVRKLA